mmetsp:Transcript_3603/g.8649  ORF Transcript_3603/g.8649 Transcript_3603/m.8649 type:complete len:104 (+) Transcript_3603:32-343(+)
MVYAHSLARACSGSFGCFITLTFSLFLACFGFLENVGAQTVSGHQGSVRVGEQNSAAVHHIDGYQREFEAWDARVDQEDRELVKRYALGNLAVIAGNLGDADR